MDSPQSIRLFIKPYCGWCHEVVDWLNENSIQHESLDVTSSREAWDEMSKISGQTKAPVIDVDGNILADFGADELETWWNENDLPLAKG